MRRALVLLLVLLASSCATYREDLNRGQRLYEENEYERALAIFRHLEEDLDSLSAADHARYAYLRGMTDYRLGSGQEPDHAAFRANARHWLAIAKAIEQQHPGGLNPDWKQRLESALDELNREVWGIGAAASTEASTPDAGATEHGSSSGAGAAAPGAPGPAPAGSPADGDAGSRAPGGKCETSADCAPGETCQAKECVVL